MTDAWGTVVAVDEQHATIRMDETGCGRCGEPGGCGGNHAGKLLCSTPRTFRMANPDGRAVGERVRIAIAAGVLGHSAVKAYVQPLLLLLAGSLAGSAVGEEPGAIGGALAGLVVGWLALRRAQQRYRDDCRQRPSIEA